MADARQRHDWEQTSWLLAKIHNVNCAKSHQMIEPNDVNPTYRGPRRNGGQIIIDADFNAAMYEALVAAESRE